RGRAAATRGRRAPRPRRRGGWRRPGRASARHHGARTTTGVIQLARRAAAPGHPEEEGWRCRQHVEGPAGQLRETTGGRSVMMGVDVGHWTDLIVAIGLKVAGAIIVWLVGRSLIA